MPVCVRFINVASSDIYTLSLHDALPISSARSCSGDMYRGVPAMNSEEPALDSGARAGPPARKLLPLRRARRSEEHTSELQSRQYLVCRLLLEKKKFNDQYSH